MIDFFKTTIAEESFAQVAG